MEIDLRVDDQNVKTTVLVQYNIFLVLKVNALLRSCNSPEAQSRASMDGRSTSDDTLLLSLRSPFWSLGHMIIIQSSCSLRFPGFVASRMWASWASSAQKKLVPHEADQWMSHQAKGWAVTFHNLTCDLQQKLGERIAESSTNAIRSSGTKSLAERTDWNCDLQQWTPLRGSCMLANESPS